MGSEISVENKCNFRLDIRDRPTVSPLSVALGDEVNSAYAPAMPPQCIA